MVAIAAGAALAASPGAEVEAPEGLSVVTETPRPQAEEPTQQFLGNTITISAGPVPADRGYGVATVEGARFAVPATDLDDPYPPVHFTCNGGPTTLRSSAGDVPFQALIAAALELGTIRGCRPELPGDLVLGGGAVEVWGVQILQALADADVDVAFEAPTDARRDRWLDITLATDTLASVPPAQRVWRLDSRARTRSALPVAFTTSDLAGGRAAMIPQENGPRQRVFQCDVTTSVSTTMDADVLAALLDRIGCEPSAPAPPLVPCDTLVESVPEGERDRALQIIEGMAAGVPCRPR